jgi:pimeloyl-ACP methyl ester carboxylesterase
MTDKPLSRQKKKQIGLLMVLLLVATLIVVGFRWLTDERRPLPKAILALESDGLVEVVQEPWLTFAPTQGTPDTGFVFYPGGRIDPQGYAPLMKAIASEGYLVVVPEMPLNIAAFHPNVVDEIIAYYADIGRWAIGGHSVGGTMAAQYTNSHREVIDGLAIWASYPADNADLSRSDIPVALIYGSGDPRVNDSSVAERRHLLPDDASYTRIDGGDHHQFGSYETDPQDQHATIHRDSQQQQIVQATLSLLDSISPTKGD